METADAQPSQARLPGLGEPLPALSGGCIYMDYNATTPVFPEVAEEMLPFATSIFGNPSSGHVYGRAAHAKIQQARERVARLINAPDPSCIVFTSCGSESDNWAIVGAVRAANERRKASQRGSDSGSRLPPPHVVCTAIEHPAILGCLTALEASEEVTWTAVPVDSEGRVDPSDVAAAVRPGETCLVTVMHSNNEVGSIQPIEEIAAALDTLDYPPGSRPLLHSDAAQSLGKVLVDVQALGVDMLTIVGHKFGAPKGIAALYLRPGLRLPNFFLGGGQESGRRAGTENLMFIAALGKAAEICQTEGPALEAHMSSMRYLMAALLLEGMPQGDVRINGPANPAHRLPNTLSVGLRNISSSALLASLSERLAASAGAACHSGGTSVSAVLQAMGVPPEFARGTLRLSTGRHTTREEVEGAVRAIVEEAEAQRAAAEKAL